MILIAFIQLIGLIFEPDVSYCSLSLTQLYVEVWLERPVLSQFRSQSVRVLPHPRCNQQRQLGLLLLDADALRSYIPRDHDWFARLHELLPQKPKALRGASGSATQNYDNLDVLDLLPSLL